MNSSSYLLRLLGSCRKNLLCNVQRLCCGRHQMFLGNWPRQRDHRQSPVPRYCSTSKAIDLVAYNRYTKRNLVDGHVEYWKMQKKKAHVLDWKIDFLINFFPLVHITVEEALELNRQNFRQLPKGQLLGCLLELLTPLMQKNSGCHIIKKLVSSSLLWAIPNLFSTQNFLVLFPVSTQGCMNCWKQWCKEGSKQDSDCGRGKARYRNSSNLIETFLMQKKVWIVVQDFIFATFYLFAGFANQCRLGLAIKKVYNDGIIPCFVYLPRLFSNNVVWYFFWFKIHWSWFHRWCQKFIQILWNKIMVSLYLH